jgi:hypothetical protein
MTTKQTAKPKAPTADLAAATLTEQKVLELSRKRISRALLKRRRQKSGQ